MCDLLKRYRKNRTILLTTQDMEEADILADRVAVLSNGKLLCCGSPEFLKKALGNKVYYTETLRDNKNYTKVSLALYCNWHQSVTDIRMPLVPVCVTEIRVTLASMCHRHQGVIVIRGIDIRVSLASGYH